MGNSTTAWGAVIGITVLFGLSILAMWVNSQLGEA